LKELHLLRHAKSSWKDAALDDHDRPLNKRGRRDAQALADHLKRTGLAPDLVLCSSALRTRQTLDFIVTAIRPPKVVIERGFYQAGRSRLLARLQEIEDEVGRVLLIAHNPGLHNLALMLASAKESDLLGRLKATFPTGALASYRFDESWRQLRPHRATLVGYLTPLCLDSGGENPAS
jgi:phosphohistidine phosphatase